MNVELQDALLTILVTVIGAVAAWLMKRAGVSDTKTEALDAIMLAVASVKSSYVDELKAKSADGVLTDFEKAEARKHAVELALKLVGPKASALIAEWGEEKIRAYIELAVAKIK